MSSTWLSVDTYASASRDEFQKVYSTQLKSSPSFFNTAPVSHIIPTENTITFAAEYRSYDVTVAQPGVDISGGRDKLDERLDLLGWAASPYVAFSSKDFGFGFAGETGQSQAYYQRKAVVQDSDYEEHLGVATYSGIGLNLYWTPAWSFVPKIVAPTLIVGAKSLNVVQTSSGQILEPFSKVTMRKYQYAVQNYEVGCNVSLKLVKRFTVIPWVNYSGYRYSTPKPSAGGRTAGEVLDPSVREDASLFWNSAPALTYGIDFAVKFWGFNVHLGGLIGILGTLNKGSDRIMDNSRTLSVSFDTKGS